MQNATRLRPLVVLVGVIASVGCGKLKPSIDRGSPDASIDSSNDVASIDVADATSMCQLKSDGTCASAAAGVACVPSFGYQFDVSNGCSSKGKKAVWCHPEGNVFVDAVACYTMVGPTGETIVWRTPNPVRRSDFTPCDQSLYERVVTSPLCDADGGLVDGADADARNTACSQPGAPLAPLTEVCSMSGTISVDPNGCCPQPSTNWDTDVSLLPTLPSESDVPSCSFRDEPAVSPGWQLKVEKVPPAQLHLNTIDHYDTRIVATRVDSGATCSVIIAVELRGESMVLPVGSTIQYTRKSVLRETDGWLSTAIRDSNGKLLLGYVADMRPEVWDADVLPELKMALTPVCDRGTGDSALNVSLSSGTDTCSAGDGAARCCSLGGETFQMEVPSAKRYRGTAPSDKVTMLIAKSGVIVPAP